MSVSSYRALMREWPTDQDQEDDRAIRIEFVALLAVPVAAVFLGLWRLLS